MRQSDGRKIHENTFFSDINGGKRQIAESASRTCYRDVISRLRTRNEDERRKQQYRKTEAGTGLDIASATSRFSILLQVARGGDNRDAKPSKQQASATNSCRFDRLQ